MTRPVLITGAAGFAGSHLIELLAGDGVPLIGAYRTGNGPEALGLDDLPGVEWRAIDALDRDAVRDAMADIRPWAIYHCAGAANVGTSWNAVLPTYELNVLGTHYLIEAVREAGLEAPIFIPGSAMVYQESTEPITEQHPVRPNSPYGLSKLAQEMLGKKTADEEQRRILLTRSFNHLGPRQASTFVASSFAEQIARIERGQAEPVLRVGNLEARRDLMDVRDTVRAYRAIVERGQAGRIYNVCAGRAYSIRTVLDGLLQHARIDVKVEIDPDRLRPHDNPLLLGDPTRLQTELGWQPVIPLERTLRDLLEYWRGVVPTDTGLQA